MRFCPKGGKRCYGSKHAALLGCADAGHRLRAYRCPACGYWHTTKEPRLDKSQSRPPMDEGGQAA